MSRKKSTKKAASGPTASTGPRDDSRVVESKRPAGPALQSMPVWVNDILGSSRFQELSDCGRGHYLQLLLHQWNLRGRGVTSCRSALHVILGIQGESSSEELEHVLGEFFELRGGRFFNRRCVEEYSRAVARYEKSSRAAESRWGQSGENRAGSKHAVEHTPKHMPDGMPDECLAHASHRSSLIAHKEGEEEEERGPADAGRGSSASDPGSFDSEREEIVYRLQASPWRMSAAKMADFDFGSVTLEEIGRWSPLAASLRARPWGFGVSKVLALCERGMSAERLQEWEAYAAEHGRPAAVRDMQDYDRPRDVPVDPHAGRRKRRKRKEVDPEKLRRLESGET